MTFPRTGCAGLYLRAILLTRLVHIPNAISASNAPPLATMVRPYLRAIFDLFDSSASGTAMRLRSSSDNCSRSTSRSDRTFSSTPRNAKEIYQSQMTRRKIREKKSIHSSRVGGPAFGFSRASGVGCAFWRNRESSIQSPVSSNRGRLGSAGMSESMSPGSRLSGSGRSGISCASACAASLVNPARGGRMGFVIANGDFFRLSGRLRRSWR